LNCASIDRFSGFTDVLYSLIHDYAGSGPVRGTRSSNHEPCLRRLIRARKGRITRDLQVVETLFASTTQFFRRRPLHLHQHRVLPSFRERTKQVSAGLRCERNRRTGAERDTEPACRNRWVMHRIFDVRIRHEDSRAWIRWRQCKDFGVTCGLLCAKMFLRSSRDKT
jgi:hypothetical protein